MFVILLSFSSLFLAGCMTNQSQLVSRDGFAFKLPQGWEINKTESTNEETRITRSFDNEDTGIAFIAIKKISDSDSRNELIEKYAAIFQKNSQMNVLISSNSITQLAGMSGNGIKKTGESKGKDGELEIEYMLFAPDSNSQLQNCLIGVFHYADRKWIMRKDIDYILRNAHADKK